MQLIYTSGTTGEPKGVMHTANTALSNLVPYAERLRLGAADVVLMASPMAHQTGFLYGLMMPIVLQARAVLLDLWDPACAAELIRDEGATFTMASTPFLADLARTVAASGKAVPSLRIFLCAGARGAGGGERRGVGSDRERRRGDDSAGRRRRARGHHRRLPAARHGGP